MRALWLATFAVWMWHQSANAQAAGAPTDNELYAAYCVGVLTAQQHDLQNTHEDPMSRALIEDVFKNIERFKSYLVSKGISTDFSTGNTLGVVSIATKRGADDYEQSKKDFKFCSERAVGNSIKQDMMHMNTCLANAGAYIRQLRCSKSDALPF